MFGSSALAPRTIISFAFLSGGFSDRVGVTPMSYFSYLHGRWKELETGDAYIVTGQLPDLTVVTNPAKDDRRDYEIRQGPDGIVQLMPVYHKEYREGDTISDLFIDHSIPGRIIWYSRINGRQKTWQLTMQAWNTTVVQLMCEVEDTVLRLVMRKLTGHLIAKVAVQSGTSWRDARKSMVPGLRQLLSKKLAFVSPQGEVLTQAHDERPLSDILGCGASRSKPEPVEEWRRFQ